MTSGWVQAETVTYDAPSRDTGEIPGGESEYIWERPAWRDRLRGLYGERFWAHPEWRRRWYEMAGLPDTGDAGFAGTDAGWWLNRWRNRFGWRYWDHPKWRRQWYEMAGLTAKEDASDVAIAPSGWAKVGDAWQTVEPLIDRRTGLYARLTRTRSKRSTALAFE